MKREGIIADGALLDISPRGFARFHLFPNNARFAEKMMTLYTFTSLLFGGFKTLQGADYRATAYFARSSFMPKCRAEPPDAIRRHECPYSAAATIPSEYFAGRCASLDSRPFSASAR